jgi:hypothetical protein
MGPHVFACLFALCFIEWSWVSVAIKRYYHLLLVVWFSSMHGNYGFHLCMYMYSLTYSHVHVHHISLSSHRCRLCMVIMGLNLCMYTYLAVFTCSFALCSLRGHGTSIIKVDRLLIFIYLCIGIIMHAFPKPPFCPILIFALFSSVIW